MTYNTFNVSSAGLCERPEEGRSILAWSLGLGEQPASPSPVKNKNEKQLFKSYFQKTGSPQTPQSTPGAKELFTQTKLEWKT